MLKFLLRDWVGFLMVEVLNLCTKETRPTWRFFCAQNPTRYSIVTPVAACFKQIKSRVELRAAKHGARGKDL